MFTDRKVKADTNVHRQIVECYRCKIANGESVLPIVVIKNPGKDIYAVLDGRHRYHARVCLEWGIREMKCAFAGDFSSLVVLVARYGFFQSSGEITEYNLVVQVGIRHYLGKGLKYPRMFFQELRTLSIGIFSHLRNG